MLELIIGAKGTGKTRRMVEQANNESKLTNGSIIYIDKSNKHMYELSNAIRLINLHEFDINSGEAFLGFLQGLISSNRDLTHIFLDNFMWLSSIEPEEAEYTFEEIDKLSKRYNVIFVISTAIEEKDIPEKYRECISCVL